MLYDSTPIHIPIHIPNNSKFNVYPSKYPNTSPMTIQHNKNVKDALFSLPIARTNPDSIDYMPYILK